MSEMRFRFTSPEPTKNLTDLRKAYITGLDRSPGRGTVEVRNGMLTIRRVNPESGRLHVPWPVEGFGVPVIGTATLSERDEPYDLAVELARGRLNDVRNQLADWELMGLTAPPALLDSVAESQRAFARAATSASDPSAAALAAAESLKASVQAGEGLADLYTRAVLEKRKEFQSPLTTSIGCTLVGDPRKAPWGTALLPCINTARLTCHWGRVAPTEGKYRWEEPDAQLSWCRAQKLAVTAGPIIDLRPGALPDWLWLFDGDYDQIQEMAVDLVRHAVARYRGKIAAWHIVARPGSGEILGLSEEEQIRMTARLLQVARNTDPQAQLVIDFDRPWSEWLSGSTFQLGPLHLADSLARADLGMAGVGVELAPGFAGLGSHMRTLFDASRLLDLYSLINLPLHVTLALPSSVANDPNAEQGNDVETRQWPRTPDETLQAAWAESWAGLALAKPFVRSVCWGQVTDGPPTHPFPFSGLFRADGSAKPVVGALAKLRSQHLT